MSKSITPVNAPGRPARIRLHEPPYDPRGIRRCSRCGSRSNWQRLVDDPIAGGWRCCWQPPEVLQHGAERHECGPLCTLAVAV
jgi:hypothetical protein